MNSNPSNQRLLALVPYGLFIVLTIWWLSLSPFSTDLSLEYQKFIWGSSYQIIAIFGGIIGLFVAKPFGGLRSTFGKSIIFFSVGLLLQSFGQSVYSYFNLFAGVQAPYPSIGDLGFFGSVFLYILGIFFLLKTVGVQLALKSLQSKIIAVLFPAAMLLGSYSIFLEGYEFDWSEKLKVFLDFGYPLGQAFYVSLAILTLIASAKTLGGLFKKPVVLFLVALMVQYFSDFYFLFHANAGTWLVGGLGDFWYMLSYLLMTVSILEVGYAMKKIGVQEGNIS